MTSPEFKEQMARLDGLKFAPATLDTHWEALNHLSIGEFEAAVTRAARECDEYPSPSILLTFVALRAPRIVGPDEDRGVPIAEPTSFSFAGRDIPVTREWRFYCQTCSDTGWAEFHCGTNGAVTCGRETCSYTHRYHNRCACWHSNPALIKRRERNAQQAHTRQTNREH